MTDEEKDELIKEVWGSLAPVFADVAQGKTQPEVLKDLITAAVTVGSHHLLVVNGFALLSTLKAIGRAPEAIISFFKNHAEEINLSPTQQGDYGG